MGRILAAADIGSNTAHLLVGETDGRNIRRIRNESEWLSLGEVVSRQGEIPPPLVDRLILELSAFRQMAQSAQAEGIYIFATEAMRSATNHEEVLRRIDKQAKVRTELITPRREAELCLRGCRIDTPDAWPALMVELGGGSAQVAICADGVVVEDTSLPVGTGRLIAETQLSYPCSRTQLEALNAVIDRHLDRISPVSVVRLIASGGVARGLLRVLHPDGDPVLAIQELEYIEWAARRLSLSQIVKRFGVKVKRASTLVPGGLFYRKLMQRFGTDFLTVSEFGVREGALLEAFEGLVKLCRV